MRESGMTESSFLEYEESVHVKFYVKCLVVNVKPSI